MGRTSAGLGALTLSSLLGSRLSRAAAEGATTVNLDRWPGVLNPPHVRPRIKRVIHLYMAGGPSHLDTFDYKPKLAEMHGQPMPESYTKGQPIAQLQGAKLNCFAPQHPFKKCGESGHEISEIFPHLATVADEIAIVRSMKTEAINHDPAHTFMNTGTTISGRPSMGSWVLYGLGAESDNLPGFVVLNSLGKYGQAQPIAQRQWHSGFLPSRFQGVEFRSKGDPVLYVSRPKGVDARRTPMAQGNGRDHHMKGFSMWLAGGGIKPGLSHGATDELGYNAVEDVVPVHDLHATILHLLGIDHLKLTYKFQGRDFRLTDVAGSVVTKLLA